MGYVMPDVVAFLLKVSDYFKLRAEIFGIDEVILQFAPFRDTMLDKAKSSIE